MANGDMSHEARELELYAENTYELYGQLQSIQANLANKLADDRFQKDLAAKLAMYWVDNAAKRYTKEHASRDAKWHEIFSKSDRMQVARSVVDSIEDEYKLGNYDHMLTAASRNRREKRELGKMVLSADEARNFAFGIPSDGAPVRNKFLGPKGMLRQIYGDEFLFPPKDGRKGPNAHNVDRMKKWAKMGAERAFKWFGYGKLAPDAIDGVYHGALHEYEEGWREGLPAMMAPKPKNTKHANILRRVGKLLDRAERAKSLPVRRKAISDAEKAIRSIGGFADQIALFSREKAHGISWQLKNLKALKTRYDELKKDTSEGKLAHPGKLSAAKKREARLDAHNKEMLRRAKVQGELARKKKTKTPQKKRSKFSDDAIDNLITRAKTSTAAWAEMKRIAERGDLTPSQFKKVNKIIGGIVVAKAKSSGKKKEIPGMVQVGGRKLTVLHTSASPDGTRPESFRLGDMRGKVWNEKGETTLAKAKKVAAAAMKKAKMFPSYTNLALFLMQEQPSLTEFHNAFKIGGKGPNAVTKGQLEDVYTALNGGVGIRSQEEAIKITARTLNPPSKKVATGGFSTIADLKRANKAAGMHWFEPSTMRFFSSKIEGGMFGGKYFISSEVPPGQSRSYTVRMAKPDARIDTIGEMGQYANRSEARNEIMRLLGK